MRVLTDDEIQWLREQGAAISPTGSVIGVVEDHRVLYPHGVTT
jgi:hypothetical protein